MMSNIMYHKEMQIKSTDTTSYQLGWGKRERTATSADEGGEDSPCALLVGTPNGASSLENTLAVPQNVEQRVTM